MMTKKEQWLLAAAKRMPSFISPNLLTVLRALFIIPIYFTYQQGLYTVVVLLFALALLTDALDGVVARYRQKESTAGKLLDPAADKVLFIGLLFLIGPDRLSSAVITTIVSLEIMLVLLAIVFGPLAAKLFHIKRKVGANNAGKIKMALEGLAILILLAGLFNTTVQAIAEVVMWLAAVFALLSIILHLNTKEPNEG